MLPRLLTVFFIACSSLCSEDAQTELGRSDSNTSLSQKEAWIYSNDSQTEFFDDNLGKESNTTFTQPAAQNESFRLKNAPLINAEDIVQNRAHKTITSSMKTEGIDLSNLAESYANSESLQGFKDAFGEEQHPSGSRSRINKIARDFAIELLVTLLVLIIAFQISGYPNAFKQLLLLSFTVGIVGLLLDTLMGLSPLNPIRSSVGFIVLLLLIRPWTKVRKWTTAIKIAITTRLVSMAIIWVIMLGLNTLLSL